MQRGAISTGCLIHAGFPWRNPSGLGADSNRCTRGSPDSLDAAPGVAQSSNQLRLTLPKVVSDAPTCPCYFNGERLTVSHLKSDGPAGLVTCILTNRWRDLFSPRTEIWRPTQESNLSISEAVPEGLYGVSTKTA